MLELIVCWPKNPEPIVLSDPFFVRKTFPLEVKWNQVDSFDISQLPSTQACNRLGESLLGIFVCNQAVQPQVDALDQN